MTDRSNKDSKKSPVKIRFKAMKDGRDPFIWTATVTAIAATNTSNCILLPETDDKSLRRKKPRCGKPRPPQEEIAGIGKVTDREQTAYGDARLYL